MSSGREYLHHFHRASSKCTLQIYWFEYSVRCNLVAIHAPLRVSHAISTSCLPLLISAASNIIERRYGLTESDASTDASYLLAGSVILYPIVRIQRTRDCHRTDACLQTGYIVDALRKRHIVLRLFMMSSLFTMFCYFWLVLPPKLTGSPLPGIAAFATGHGFSPRRVCRLSPLDSV